jgi:hypothetical protein
MIDRPSAASWATFRCTAGFAHMAEFIAGARSTGHSAQSSSVVSRSSAAPAAALASRSAVAGATTTRSARAASSMWAPSGKAAGSNDRDATGRPVRAANVAAPTNRRALRVSTAVTPAPRCTSTLASMAAL